MQLPHVRSRLIGLSMFGTPLSSAHRYTLRWWVGCPLWQLVTYRLQVVSVVTLRVALVKPAQAHITVHSFYVLSRVVVLVIRVESPVGVRECRCGLLILTVRGSRNAPFWRVAPRVVSLLLARCRAIV